MPTDPQKGVYVRVRCSPPGWNDRRVYHATAGKGKTAKRATSTYSPTDAARSAGFRFLGLTAPDSPWHLQITHMETGHIWVRLP